MEFVCDIVSLVCNIGGVYALFGGVFDFFEAVLHFCFGEYNLNFLNFSNWEF